MANTEILKVKMFEKKVTYADGADELNVSIQTFNDKMNKKRSFKCEEAQALSNLLKLAAKERAEIFLM